MLMSYVPIVFRKHPNPLRLLNTISGSLEEEEDKLEDSERR